MSAAAAEELGRLLETVNTTFSDWLRLGGSDRARTYIDALRSYEHACIITSPILLAERAALVEEIERLRRELMAALVADQEHGAGMSIILRNWCSRGVSGDDWRALDVSVQFGVGQPEISVISEYLCEGGVIDHAVHPSGIAGARARALIGGSDGPV